MSNVVLKPSRRMSGVVLRSSPLEGGQPAHSVIWRSRRQPGRRAVVSFRRIAVSLWVGAALLVGATSQAQALTRTTQWYTIDIQPPNAATSRLFLGTHDRFTGARITLKRYQSGNEDMQWTPVLPEYPASPDVTGGGLGPEDLIPCNPFAGNCSFQEFEGAGPPGSPPPRPSPVFVSGKFVNRGSGYCLHIDPWTKNGDGTAVVQADCRRNFRRQIWSPRLLNGPVTPHFSLFQKRQQNPGVKFCLDVNKGNGRDHRRRVGTFLEAWRCYPSTNQAFRFLEVGSATCETRYPSEICGVRDRR